MGKKKSKFDIYLWGIAIFLVLLGIVLLSVTTGNDVGTPLLIILFGTFLSLISLIWSGILIFTRKGLRKFRIIIVITDIIIIILLFVMAFAVGQSLGSIF